MADPANLYPPLNLNTTSPVFDTLQGKWSHSFTVYIPVNAALPPHVPFTIVNPGDSLEFKPDFTGKDHFPATTFFPTVNFTYNLLPDDSTLIFNIGTLTNPLYDTCIILNLKPDYLVLKSRAKTITTFPPPMSSTYYIHSVLTR